jgi:hypothetical protein
LPVAGHQLPVENQTRPAGVYAIACLFLFSAAACTAIAILTALGIWPLAWGRFLVADLVTMGPAIFLVGTLTYAVIALGLLALKNWARRLVIVIAAAGLFFLIAPISSAVVDLRIVAIVINGAQIIVRVVVMWYLIQEQVTEDFA